MKYRNCVTLFVCVVLAISSGVGAAVFTAGPGGAYSTIQGAIDAALAAGGDNYIKVRAESYDESLSIPDTMISGSLTFLGGWDIWFAARNSDPASTTIHPSGDASAVVVEHVGGVVRFDGMTFTGERTGGYGGGVYAQIRGFSELYFDHCVIRDSTSGYAGGGAYIKVLENAVLEILDCEIINNSVVNVNGGIGGGIYLYHNAGSTVNISWSSIRDNSVAAGGSSNAKGGGLFLEMWGYRFNMLDCELSGNALGSSTGDRQGSEAYLKVSQFPDLYQYVELRRNRYSSTGSIGSASMLEVFSNPSNSQVATMITDSWFSGGAGAGIDVEMYNGGSFMAANNTVTECGGVSINLQSDGSQGSNAIDICYGVYWNNGTDTPTTPAGTTHSNLIGTDPLFVDPAGGNYRLQASSPAIDVFTDYPAWDFSDIDLHNTDRRIGSRVDCGGSEWGGIFGDGFEVGTTRVWSSAQ